MKQPKQINSCSGCIHDGYEMCLIGDYGIPIPSYPNIPSWCPLPDAVDIDSIQDVVKELLDKKAEEDNRIDLNAYAKGIYDMYEYLNKKNNGKT